MSEEERFNDGALLLDSGCSTEAAAATMPQNAQFAHLFQTIFFKFFFLGGNGQFGPSIHKN